MDMWRPVLRTYNSSINFSRENGVSYLPNGEGKIITKAKVSGTGDDITKLRWDIANLPMKYDPDNLESCYEPENYNIKISGLEDLIHHHWLRYDHFSRAFGFQELRRSLDAGDSMDKFE
jgi:hypothetical protein